GCGNLWSIDRRSSAWPASILRKVSPVPGRNFLPGKAPHLLAVGHYLSSVSIVVLVELDNRSCQRTGIVRFEPDWTTSDAIHMLTHDRYVRADDWNPRV